MNKNPNRPRGRDTPDEELIDMLIAVSVVAKRLAEKLREKEANKETSNGRL
jgi:hypothetical protein